MNNGEAKLFLQLNERVLFFACLEQYMTSKAFRAHAVLREQ